MLKIYQELYSCSVSLVYRTGPISGLYPNSSIIILKSLFLTSEPKIDAHLDYYIKGEPKKNILLEKSNVLFEREPYFSKG